MQRSLIFAAALVGAAAMSTNAGYAGDTSGSLAQNLDTYGPSGAGHDVSTELNPQPLPPGSQIEPSTSTGGHIPKDMLNPQPLPPGSPAATGPSTQLNPQPLPPGLKSPYQGTELNPQPLPPGRAAQ